MPTFLRRVTALFLLLMTACAPVAPTAQISATPVPSATAEPTKAPSTVPTNTPAPTATALATATAEATATATATPTATLPPTPTAPPYRAEPITVESAAGVQELAVWGKGMASSIAAAPQSGRFAITAHRGVTLYNADLSEAAFLASEELGRDLAISADGRRIAYVRAPVKNEPGQPYTIILWDAETQTETGQIPLEPGLALEPVLAFAPDSQALAAGMSTGEIRLYNLEDAALTCTLGGHTNSINAVLFAADGSRAFSSAKDGTLRAWDLAACGPLWQAAANHKPGRLALSASGETLLDTALIEIVDGKLAESEAGRALYRWEAETGSPIGEPVVVSEAQLTSADFLPDGRIVASDRAGTARLLDAAGKEIAALQAFTSPVNALAALPDSRVIIAAVQGVRVWDANTQAEPVSLDGYSTTIGGLSQSPDGSALAAISGEAVQVWDTTAGRLRYRLGFPYGPKFAIFTPYGQRLLVGSGENLFTVHSAADGKELQRVERQAPAVEGAVSIDGKYLAIASETGIDLYDPAALTLTLALPLDLAETVKVSALAFSPDGSTLAVGMTTGQIQLWALPEGKRRAALYQDQNRVGSIRFSLDGKYMYSRADRYAPRIWDTFTGQSLKVIKAKDYDGMVLGWDFSPDGSLVAQSQYRSFDGEMRFINKIIDPSRPLMPALAYFRIGGDGANAVLFSPDGARFYAAGGYGVIYVYGVRGLGD